VHEDEHAEHPSEVSEHEEDRMLHSSEATGIRLPRCVVPLPLASKPETQAPLKATQFTSTAAAPSMDSSPTSTTEPFEVVVAKSTLARMDLSTALSTLEKMRSGVTFSDRQEREALAVEQALFGFKHLDFVCVDPSPTAWENHWAETAKKSSAMAKKRSAMATKSSAMATKSVITSQVPRNGARARGPIIVPRMWPKEITATLLTQKPVVVSFSNPFLSLKKEYLFTRIVTTMGFSTKEVTDMMGHLNDVYVVEESAQKEVGAQGEFYSSISELAQLNSAIASSVDALHPRLSKASRRILSSHYGCGQYVKIVFQTKAAEVRVEFEPITVLYSAN